MEPRGTHTSRCERGLLRVSEPHQSPVKLPHAARRPGEHFKELERKVLRLHEEAAQQHSVG